LTLDQTGSAQKGGAVVSHLVLSKNPIEAPAKINFGNADVILAFDLVGATGGENLKCADPERTTIVVNSSIVPTAEQIRLRTLMGPQALIDQVDQATRRGRNVYVDANRLAESLFGSHLAVNLFITGVAWQAGLIPISFAAIEQAVKLNGVDVERNLQTFAWGRKYYQDASWVEQQAGGKSKVDVAPAFVLADRVRDLTVYQNAQIAAEYEAFVREIAAAVPELEEPVGRYLYKLIAVKDEYEVARMLTSTEFEARVRGMFAQVESIGYNLHPPLLRRFGVTKKMQLGAWARPMLRVLAGMKGLRGTAFDVFGYNSHRKLERSLAGWYRDLMREAVASRTAENAAIVAELACLPDQIRGYEQIKESSIERVQAKAKERLAALKQSRQVQPI
jgi:indolepyruvate ferredoxin oxidoreductase